MSELFPVQVRVIVGGHPFDLRANDVAELTVLLAQLADSEAVELLTTITAKANAVPVLVAPPAPVHPAKTAEVAQSAPQAVPAQTTGGQVYSGPGADKFKQEDLSCSHGFRVFRSGQGAKGPWTAMFCPLPQDRKSEQCSAVWGRK